MKSVISDLLFLTRTSDSPQAHVDVRQIIMPTLSLVRTGARTSTTIEADLAETAGLLAHPSRLGQVFLNVIINAFHDVSREPPPAIISLSLSFVDPAEVAGRTGGRRGATQ
jgi:C4-dicarboxylate-specific signal transduction histidine kinase